MHCYQKPWNLNSDGWWVDISAALNSCTVNVFCLCKCWRGQFEEYCTFAVSSTAHHFDWIIIIPNTEGFLQRTCSTISRGKQNQNKEKKIKTRVTSEKFHSQNLLIFSSCKKRFMLGYSSLLWSFSFISGCLSHNLRYHFSSMIDNILRLPESRLRNDTDVYHEFWFF